MHFGRPLLNRRSFLAEFATGMGGVALTALLNEHGLLAAEPWKPDIRPEAPLAARKPHFAAKAKRVSTSWTRTR